MPSLMGNMGSIDMGELLQTVKVYGSIGIVIFVVAMVFIFFLFMGKYKIKVFIAKYYAENRFIWKTDKAKKTRTKEGIEEFKLFKANRSFKPPTMMHRIKLFPFPKDFIFLIEDIYGDFHEMGVDSGEGKIKPVSHDLMLWKVAESNKAIEAYRKKDDNFWMKYGPTIATMAGFAILFVMVIVILYYMKDVSAAFESAASSLSSVGQPIPVR